MPRTLGGKLEGEDDLDYKHVNYAVMQCYNVELLWKEGLFQRQSVHAIVELCFKRRVMFLRHGLCSKKTDYVRATWLMLRFGRRKSITQSFGA